MEHLNLGSFNIARVVDYEGVVFSPAQLFPDATPEAIEAERTWLAPRFYNPEDDRLIMAFHSYVIRTPDKVIVVDTGGGNDKERPAVPLWHHRHGDYLDQLARLGIQPEDVDIVVITHLHIDHVGWNTRLVDGVWVPTFPNAEYLIGRTEYAFWTEAAAAAPAGEVFNHGLLDDSVEPVRTAGQMRLVGENEEIAEGIRLTAAPGHTPGQLMVELSSGGQRAVMTGDTVQHPIQLAYPDWSSAYCADPDVSRDTRCAFVDSVADTDTYILTTHFAEPVVARVARRNGVYALEI